MNCGYRNGVHMCAAVLAVLLAGLLLACGGIGAPTRDLSRTLVAADIVGRWVLTDRSRDVAQRHGLTPRGEPYTVTFHQDGMLTFDSLESAGGPHHVKATGAWTLRHDTTGDSNQVLHNLVRVELRGSQFHFGIDEKGGQLVMWQSIGDPDLWEFFEYERRP